MEKYDEEIIHLRLKQSEFDILNFAAGFIKGESIKKKDGFLGTLGQDMKKILDESQVRES